MRSIQKSHRAGPVAWNVSVPRVGGYIYDGVRSAATSDVATTRPASMRPGMPTLPGTLSSAALSQVKTGFGATGPTSTRRGPTSHLRNIIPSTNLYPDQPDGFPPTGKTSWWDPDEAMGRRRDDGSGCPPPKADPIAEFGPSRFTCARLWIGVGGKHHELSSL